VTALETESATLARGGRPSKALAAWRKARAVELASQGLTYELIANQCGWSHRATAYKAVHAALNEQTVEAVAGLRQRELDRLDALQLAVWRRAMDGDVAAVLAAQRIILARCRLLGLDRPEKTSTRFHAPVVLTPEEISGRAAPGPEPGDRVASQ
jgi:IS5 family transposase